MDELKSFLKALGTEVAREAFAARCGSSVGHLRNVMYGLRPCSPELAAALEIESAGAVTRKALFPDRWHRIWPELINAQAAPSAPQNDLARSGAAC